MSAALQPVSVAIASCHFDADLVDPEQLIERYHAMTGWADAVARAGPGAVTVVQRFAREAVLRRGSVAYRFVTDATPIGARFAGVVGSLRPDAVHVDGLVFPAVVGCLRLRLARQTAIVVQDHGGVRLPWNGLRKPVMRVLFGLGLGAADGFMFTARAQAQPWRDAGIIRARHAVYEVLESSTDMGSWQPQPKAEVGGVLAGDPAILWVARLDTNKDPMTVLEGFAQAAASLPRASLTLVYGDDGLLPAVRDWMAARPQLQSRIRLTGSVDRTALPALYRSADIFVSGSHREVACFSLIEALAFGVTPVVTDIPAFRTITAGGEVGALFPPGDPRALTRALVAVGAGDHRARRASVRAHFERELSWSAVGKRALAAYQASATERRARFGAR